MLVVDHFCTALTTRVRWKIENFSVVAPKDGPEKKFLNSENFSFFKSRLKFCLSFYPICRSGPSNYSSLYLVSAKLDGEEAVKLNYKIWIENTDGKKIGVQTEHTRVFSTKDYGWGFPIFVRHPELYPPSDFIKNNTVFICCEIRRNTDQPDFKPLKLDNKAAENMWLFYNQPEAGDECTIQIGTKNFKVKKHLLTEQSEVFAAMFQSSMQESRTGVIKMTNLTSRTLKHFVRYVHLGYLDEDGAKYADKLLAFADKYLIAKLKDECISILKKGIGQGNIFDRLVLAFTHNAGELKDHLVGRLIDKSFGGNWKWMMQTDEWFDFVAENKEISREITAIVYEKLPLFFQ